MAILTIKMKHGNVIEYGDDGKWTGTPGDDRTQESADYDARLLKEIFGVELSDFGPSAGAALPQAVDRVKEKYRDAIVSIEADFSDVYKGVPEGVVF